MLLRFYGNSTKSSSKYAYYAIITVCLTSCLLMPQKSVFTCPCGSRYWCYAVLYCTVLCCAVLYCTVLYCTARVLWTAQILVNKGMSSISTSIPLTSSKLLLSILFLCSKCLTLKPANPEVLCLLAEVIGEEQDKKISFLVMTCHVLPLLILFIHLSIYSIVCPLVTSYLAIVCHLTVFPSLPSAHLNATLSSSLSCTMSCNHPPLFLFLLLNLMLLFIQGHLGDVDMMKEHIEDALTLIGALNVPGVSELTLASVYHKLASSFLSSVSTVYIRTMHYCTLFCSFYVSVSVPLFQTKTSWVVCCV